MMQLCIATTSVPGLLTRKLELIAEAGFTGVELYEPDLLGFDGAPVELAQFTRELGLTIDLFQPFHNFEGLRGIARERALRRLKHKLDLMQMLEAKTLLVGTSHHPEASSDRKTIVQDFTELAARAADHGIRAALLALPWAHHIHTDLAALEIVESVDSSHFGLALNSFYSLADGSRPAHLHAIPGTRVFHVQLSDAPATDFDIRRLKGHFGLLPGQGGLNLEGFVRVIAQAGYRGPWSIARINSSAPGRRQKVTTDGYRALVSLLSEVARTEPILHDARLQLPERVYTSGVEFIEFAVNTASELALARVLESLCFRRERRHVSKSVDLWRQGAINLVVNTESEGYAADIFAEHGPSVCDMGLRVRDAAQTVARATALGAPPFSQPVASGELDIPAIQGVGGNVVHFIDERSDLHRMWDIDFDPVPNTEAIPPAGLRRIDHVAQTMRQEDMQSWLTYYTTTFEMQQRAVVDMADPGGVVLSQAIASPEGEVRLILNGASEQQTFAGTFLAERLGAGVQHIALLTDDIFETSALLASSGFERLGIAGNYYDDLRVRFDLDDAMVDSLREGNILYDSDEQREYFQIYSTPIFDGFFFEIVERRGGYGAYGERNAPIRLSAQLRHSNYNE